MDGILRWASRGFLRSTSSRRRLEGFRTLGTILVVSLLIAGVAGQPRETPKGCASAHYRIVAIPLRPYHVNDAGAIAGMTEQHRAALWTEKDGLKIADLPQGFHHAEGVDVNLNGQLLGTASTADGSRRQSFLYEGGKVTLLPGDGARANAINAAGELAGEAKLAGSTGPVLWRQGKALSLGACCGGRATGLNDHGEVVGEAYDKQGRYQAFVWTEKAGLRVIGPADTYSAAATVNQRGDVIVYAFTNGSWLYRDGIPTKMELSKRWPSQPRGMNACGVVVGSFGANSDESEAFLWDDKSGFRNLNDLVAMNSGWKLEVASSINERGEIAGWGDHGGDDDAGFLLIPETQ
jgi:probable HAF family extracellular repeat protein